MTVKTRFAPSPTGYLHVGGARTALFSWLYAKKNNGKFVLRIEDTDLERSTDDAIKAIFCGMEWLGLKEDEGPFYQTKRFDRYKEVVQDLLASGKAYRCYCSKERLDNLRENQKENKQKPKYDGCCRNLSNQDQEDNKPFVIRFRNPNDGVVAWNDAVKGEIAIANAELDDFIIARTDGSPTYNFCVVIDDLDMEITHVIRGDDHVNNTPRQINLYKALNANIPVFAHVPMILGEDGKKLSKRHGAVSVMQYRDDGYLPEALLNYLVRLGWSYKDQEIFSLDEMEEYFDIANVNAAPSAFNLDKLNWINQHYMRTLPAEKVAKALAWQFENLEIPVNNGPELVDIIPIMAEKSKTLKELALASSYFYKDFAEYDKKAFKKHLTKAALNPLRLLKQKFENLNDTDWENAKSLHLVLNNLSQELEIGMGKIGMPLRVAITGSGSSPDIGTTLKLLGKNKVIDRVNRALEKILKRVEQSS